MADTVGFVERARVPFQSKERPIRDAVAADMRRMWPGVRIIFELELRLDLATGPFAPKHGRMPRRTDVTAIGEDFICHAEIKSSPSQRGRTYEQCIAIQNNSHQYWLVALLGTLTHRDFGHFRDETCARLAVSVPGLNGLILEDVRPNTHSLWPMASELWCLLRPEERRHVRYRLANDGGDASRQMVRDVCRVLRARDYLTAGRADPPIFEESEAAHG